MLKVLKKITLFGFLPVIVLSAAGLIWLRFDAAQPQAEYFDSRQGQLGDVEILDEAEADGQTSTLVALRSNSGLGVTVRVIRPAASTLPLPTLVVLGAHRTGSNAARLFGNVGGKAVVAMDYPFDGPDSVRGIAQVLRTLPLARQAFRDTPPAVSLLVDWLEDQAWVNSDELFIVGASLGVPFATLAAARDHRIDGAVLVHGAADNRAWLEIQVARRNDVQMLHRPLATIIHWLAYGPTFDTAKNVQAISPRPVAIVGARQDERTPAAQTEALYEAAGEPKTMRWTSGRHIQPNRAEIVNELLAMLDEVMPFLAERR